MMLARAYHGWSYIQVACYEVFVSRLSVLSWRSDVQVAASYQDKPRGSGSNRAARSGQFAKANGGTCSVDSLRH